VQARHYLRAASCAVADEIIPLQVNYLKPLRKRLAEMQP